jgi:hypothetical protein
MYAYIRHPVKATDPMAFGAMAPEQDAYTQREVPFLQHQ